MTDAREIIAVANHCAADNASAHDLAEAAITALTFAGFRILGPDEIDGPTVEKCAEVVDDEIVEIYEDSPDIDIECNNLVRRAASALRAIKP